MANLRSVYKQLSNKINTIYQISQIIQIFHENQIRLTDFTLKDFMVDETNFLIYLTNLDSASTTSFKYLYGFQNVSGSPELLMRKWKEYASETTLFLSTDVYTLGLLIFKIYSFIDLHKVILLVLTGKYERGAD